MTQQKIFEYNNMTRQERIRLLEVEKMKDVINRYFYKNNLKKIEIYETNDHISIKANDGNIYIIKIIEQGCLCSKRQRNYLAMYKELPSGKKMRIAKKYW